MDKSAVAQNVIGSYEPKFEAVGPKTERAFNDHFLKNQPNALEIEGENFEFSDDDIDVQETKV